MGGVERGVAAVATNVYGSVAVLAKMVYRLPAR